jgi:hypothetical protein
MDTAPNSELPEVTHRRRHTSAWQRIPRWVKISVAVCLVLLTISLMLRDRIMDLAKNRRQSGTGQQAESIRASRREVGKALDSMMSTLKPVDLELSEASLNFETRRIEGVATNKSEHPYSDIRITFALPTADLTAQDSEIVTIARLGPHASARFASDPVPTGVRQWAVVGITGTPK